MSSVIAPARGEFAGFSREGLQLLGQLALNNHRDWFEQHRERYRALLLQPAMALVSELGDLLCRRVTPGLRAEPRVGGSILRPRRDARFVRGEPYRAHMELCSGRGAAPAGGTRASSFGCSRTA
jgi:uncharacterized protein (DUF2461 family)